MYEAEIIISISINFTKKQLREVLELLTDRESGSSCPNSHSWYMRKLDLNISSGNKPAILIILLPSVLDSVGKEKRPYVKVLV